MNKIRHLKNNKKEKKFKHKTASPAKRPKCRYNFVAFTWRLSCGEFLMQFYLMLLAIQGLKNSYRGCLWFC